MREREKDHFRKNDIHEMAREKKRGSKAKRPWNWIRAITTRVPSQVLFLFLFDLGRDGTLGKVVKKCGEKKCEKGGKSV